MPEGPAPRLVEIRSYELKLGKAVEFDRLVTERAVPLLRRHGVDLVAFGPSLHDNDTYYLMRAYADLAELERSEAAFYGSEEWRLGPRAAVLACIERYISIVVEMDDDAIEHLRRRARSGDDAGHMA